MREVWEDRVSGKRNESFGVRWKLLVLEEIRKVLEFYSGPNCH
jgi:hypothetical protein